MIEIQSPEYICALCCPNADVKEVWANDIVKRVQEVLPHGIEDMDVRTGEHRFIGKGLYSGQWRRAKVLMIGE
jgi:hypothetical protein